MSSGELSVALIETNSRLIYLITGFNADVIRKPDRPHLLEALVVVAVLCLVATARYGAAIADDRLVIHNPDGDSTGTVGWICDLVDTIDRRGPSLLYGEVFPSERIVGATEHLPLINWWWRLRYYVTSKIVRPFNVYEALIAVFFVTNGLCAYLLGRSVSGGPIGGAVLATALLAHENFDRRAFFHNGLATYGFALLTVWWSAQIARRPAPWKFVGLTLLLVGGFLENEYYGYYGGAFSAVFLVVHFRRGLVRLLEARHRFTIALCGLAVVAPLMLSYPTLFVSKPLARLGLISLPSLPEVMTARGSFHGFGLLLADIPRLFAPGLPWIGAWMPDAIGGAPLEWEMTYKFGLLVPLLIGALWWTEQKRWAGREPTQYKLFAPFVSAALVLLAMSLSGRYALSLAHITWLVAPVLRVTTRALLFVNIALFLALAVLVQNAWNTWSWAGRLGLVICTVLAIFDLRPSPVSTKEIPVVRRWEIDQTAMGALARQPRGVLLTLPYRDYDTETPESEYGRIEEFCFHPHAILNVMPPSEASRSLSRTVNSDVNLADLARRMGVHYIRATTAKVEPQNTAGLRRLVATDESVVFATGVTGSVAASRDRVARTLRQFGGGG